MDVIIIWKKNIIVHILKYYTASCILKAREEHFENININRTTTALIALVGYFVLM